MRPTITDPAGTVIQTASADELARRLLRVAGGGQVVAVHPLSGGRNNRVFRVVGDGQDFLLKCFFRNSSDSRDRFGHERAFLEYAGGVAVSNVPRLLAADETASALLCEFVDGKTPPRGPVERRHVDAAIGLVRSLANGRTNPLADRLPPASEACFRLEEHIAIVDRRLARLEHVIPQDDIAATAHRWVQKQLLPCWVSIRDQIRAQSVMRGDREWVLEPGQRLISPSDFGFHNAVERPNGELTFVDFEYAGWDDPAKLVGDFFAQPDVPVHVAWYPVFRDAVCDLTDDPDRARWRCELLLKLHRLKWCGIVLNEFLPVDSARRAFARGSADDPRPAQLAKAERLLTIIEEEKF